MSENYYIDTNALIKYSCYQDYLTEPEYGVREIRELINRKQDNFFLSHLTLWEFYQVLLKFYCCNNQKGKAASETASDRRKKFLHVFSEIKESVKNSLFLIDNTALTSEIFIESQKLMMEYGFNQGRKLDFIDALHIALVQFLNKQKDEKIILISADKTMIEISEKEGLEVLFIQK